MNKFNAGDKIRLTRAFLRSTGQYAGQDANATWTVQACDCARCASGEYVATNQSAIIDYFTAEELAAEPYLRMRHLNASNIERRR